MEEVVLRPNIVIEVTLGLEIKIEQKVVRQL